MNPAQAMRRFIGRCILSAIDDAPGVQELQVEILDGELHDGVERFADYGFTSVPHAEAEGVIVFPNGTRAGGIVIATADRRYRITGMAPGEVAIHDDQEQIVRLFRDRIEIASPFKVVIDAPTVEVTADDVTVTSDNINLGGGGGPAVARVGDPVAGGVIASGSSKVKAA